MSATKIVGEIVESRISEVIIDEFQKEMLKHAGWMGIHIKMPRRGRYQVWDGFRLVADHIKHRKEAKALIKLLGETNGDS